MHFSICNYVVSGWNICMMKIYFSRYYDDYIFVIGGQPYLIDSRMTLFNGGMTLSEVWPEHLKNSRMHKRQEDKEVIFICTIRD